MGPSLQEPRFSASRSVTGLAYVRFHIRVRGPELAMFKTRLQCLLCRAAAALLPQKDHMRIQLLNRSTLGLTLAHLGLQRCNIYTTRVNIAGAGRQIAAGSEAGIETG